MQRMRCVVVDGRRRGMHRLSEELAAENTAKPIAFVDRLEPVLALLFQPQSMLEFVERPEDRLLHRRGTAAQRPCQVSAGSGFVGGRHWGFGSSGTR